MGLWDDINLLFEVLLRLGARALAFLVSCAAAYNAYHAGISAIKGVNTEASAPVANPESAGIRFAALTWCLIASVIAILGFSYTFDFDIIGTTIRTFR